MLDGLLESAVWQSSQGPLGLEGDLSAPQGQAIVLGGLQ